MNPDKPVRCSFLFAHAGGSHAERAARRADEKGGFQAAAQKGYALILRATAEDKR